MAAASVAEVSATKTEAVKPSTGQGRSKICRTRRATKISDLGTLAEEQAAFSLTVMGGGGVAR